jgi:phospholipid transport system substrate-binding protein
VRAYVAKLEPYGGSQLRVVGSEPSGGEVVVHSQVVRPSGQPVQIDWHVMGENGQYKVTDVFVDRVSMKATQRDEFAQVIQNNGGQPSALLAVLRQQIHGNRPASASPPQAR